MKIRNINTKVNKYCKNQHKCKKINMNIKKHKNNKCKKV